MAIWLAFDRLGYVKCPRLRLDQIFTEVRPLRLDTAVLGACVFSAAFFILLRSKMSRLSLRTQTARPRTDKYPK